MLQNKKGSILLYTLFLSSFLILFFISFQGEIEKLLRGAKDSEASVREISSLQDALVLLRNTPMAYTTVGSNNLSLVSLTESGTVFTESLGGNAPEEYWITSSGGATSLSLSVISGGPISYHLAAFNSGSETNAELISSGVTTIVSSLDLSGSLDTHILLIDPLGGQVQYTLDVGATITLPSSSSYRLERDINGYREDMGTYDILHFAPKSRTPFGFDYAKMGMYLSE